MSLAASDKLGPYQIIGLIGAGGMGEVYRGRDTKLGREVAIKVLPDAVAQDPERLSRFDREAKALAALNHPNVAQVYGVEESNGVRALVMELVSGTTLQAPLPIETALNYARQIADAPEAAHEKGIIHRDLKPGNIMITPEGVVKVLDFGLATILSRDVARDPVHALTVTLATQPGVIVGTVAYMSPEQASGKPVDRRSDIWSFGVVLYEMLVGERLFDDATGSHILARVLTAPVGTQSSVRNHPNGDPRTARTVPGSRRQDAPARYRRSSRGDSTMAGKSEWCTGRRGGPSLTVAHWLVVGMRDGNVAFDGGSLGAGLVANNAIRRSSPLRFSVDLGPDALSRTRMSAAISPDGRRIVFPVRSGSGRGQLATRLLDQSNATVLPGSEGGRDPFFKPDGQWIGFFADNKLKKISVQGDPVITLCDLTANNGDRGASWGDDDMIIATLDAHHLFRVPAGGGKPELLRTRPQQTGQIDYRWPQVLPRSETAIVTAGIVGDFDNAGIAAVSLKTGNVKIIAQGGYFGRYLDSGHLIYIHEGTLFGVLFDSKRLETRGTPAPILEDMLGAGATNGAGQLDFSKNGTFVYRSDNTQRGILEVALIDAEGKKTPLSMPSGAVLTPRFSPDGKRVAIAVNGDIFVQDLERGAITRITVTAADNRYPVWTPDGTHIVYSSRGSIWWTRADGSAMPKRILETKSTVASGSFSPTGSALRFSSPGKADSTFGP